MIRIATSIFIIVALPGAAPADDWLHYASDPQRNGVSQDAPDDLSAVLWTTNQHPIGTTIAFEGPSSPVVYSGRVYANTRHIVSNQYQKNKLVAFEASSGAVLFETLIDKAILDSWSSPAVDTANGTVLLASGFKLFSIDAVTGDIRWATPLARTVVNASPLVVVDPVVGRAFITDYDGFGDAASLYCINTSPFDTGANPYLPGDIVWQESIGTASGATPAYDNGDVYLSSIAASGFGCDEVGYLTAFDIDAPPVSRRLWSTCVGDGFFGGVCFSNGFVYVASYDLNGTGDNSTLVKVNAADGAIIWTIPCERTSSIPVVVGDRIYLSAGINGFGSVPKVQAFQDNGASAVKLWDTYVDTAGSLIVGGWTHQPLYADGLLYVGRIPLSGSFYGAYTDLYMLDVSRAPTDPLFVRDHRVGVGSSPALAEGRLYSIGPVGLSAIAHRGDCDGDGTLTGLDIQCFTNLLLNGASPSEITLMDFNLDALLSLDDAPGLCDALVSP